MKCLTVAAAVVVLAALAFGSAGAEHPGHLPAGLGGAT
jgi:hypothetical protein